MSKLYVDVVKEALENLSGKKLPDKGYTELADVYSDFNDLYTCKVTFSVTPAGAVVTVKNSKGEEVGAHDDGKYYLKEGTYKYNVSADGYVSKEEQTLVITNTDETVGTKTVTVTLVAAGE